MTMQQKAFLDFNTLRVLNVNAIRARRTDPQTSQAAAQTLKRADTHCLRILRIYAQSPTGLTDAEIEATGVVKHAWKRCSDLRRWGLIAPVKVDGKIVTRIAPSGRAQQVCAITVEGWRVLEKIQNERESKGG